ncbi:hypothetical protein FKP32DRAFT_1673739 [Trametes sanguinea]|nr:hypothetical protein FKP32DRAFT_1673739 [Trametes sanguinea]
MSSYHDDMDLVAFNPYGAAYGIDYSALTELLAGSTDAFDPYEEMLGDPAAFADVDPAISWGPYPSSHLPLATSGPSGLSEISHNPHTSASPVSDADARGYRHHDQPTARPPTPTTPSTVPPSTGRCSSEPRSSLSRVTTDSRVFSTAYPTVTQAGANGDYWQHHSGRQQEDVDVPPSAQGSNRKRRSPQLSTGANGSGFPGAHAVYPAALHPSDSLHSDFFIPLTDLSPEDSPVTPEAAAEASLPKTRKRRRNTDDKDNDAAPLAKQARHVGHASPHHYDSGEYPATDRALATSAQKAVERESTSNAVAFQDFTSAASTGNLTHRCEAETSSVNVVADGWARHQARWLHPGFSQTLATLNATLHDGLDMDENEFTAGSGYEGGYGALHDVPVVPSHTYPPPLPSPLTQAPGGPVAASLPEPSRPTIVAPQAIHPVLMPAFPSPDTNSEWSLDEDSLSSSESLTPVPQDRDSSTPKPHLGTFHTDGRYSATPVAHQSCHQLTPQLERPATVPPQLPPLPPTTLPATTSAAVCDPATQDVYPKSHDPRTAVRVRRGRGTARGRVNPYRRSRRVPTKVHSASTPEAEELESSSSVPQQQEQRKPPTNLDDGFVCPGCDIRLKRPSDLPRHALWLHINVRQKCAAKYHSHPCYVNRRDGAERHWSSTKCMGKAEFKRQYNAHDQAFGPLGRGETAASRDRRIMRKMRKQYLVIEMPCWEKLASANGEKLSAMLQLLKPQGIDDPDRIRLLEEYLREDAKLVYTCNCCGPPGCADEVNEGVPSPKPRKDRARERRKDQHVAERCSESDPGPESEEDTPPLTHIGIDASDDPGRESPDIPLRLALKGRRTSGKATRSVSSKPTRATSAAAFATAAILTPPSRAVAVPATAAPATSTADSYRASPRPPPAAGPSRADCISLPRCHSGTMLNPHEVLDLPMPSSLVLPFSGAPWDLLSPRDPRPGDAGDTERLFAYIE